MGKRLQFTDADRFLVLRNLTYHYKRRVPATVATQDPRAPFVRLSLKTSDLALARIKRDELEDADDTYWSKLTLGESSDEARVQYLAAVKRAEARGFTYRPNRGFATSETIEEIVRRFEAVFETRTPVTTIKAVLGHEEPPAITISEAFRVYCDEIAHAELKDKSPNQKRHWLNNKQRAVNTFISLVGDKPINQVTRDDALKLRSHWMKRIAPKDGSEPTATKGAGNRDIGNMRNLISEYFKLMEGDNAERKNPFHGLTCGKDAEKARPPFPTDWITEKFLQPSRLAMLNEEARGIFLGLVETGARPSELCNLVPDQIVLDDPVPHLVIKHRREHGDQREVKTDTSEREIPLVGVSLAVFQKFPKGFPRYKDKEDAYSAAVNKFLKENELLPLQTKKQELPYTVYSLRHAFEDRMKEAGIGDEMRKIIFGHGRDREAYGEGGSLYWRSTLLSKMALPFDPSIV